MATHFPDGLKALVSFLERGLVSGGDREELVHRLGDVFQAPAVSVGQGFGFAPWFQSNGLPPGWTDAHTRYQHQDPGPAILDERGLGSCYRIRSDSTREQTETDLFRTFRGFGFEDGLIARMPSPFGSPVYMVVYRGAGAALFSDDDAFLLRLLHPMLCRALAARTALQAMRQPPMEDLSMALRRLRAHVFVGFPAGTVEWTGTARSHVEAELGVLTGARSRRLDEAIVRLASDARWGGQTAVLHHALHAEVAWVPPEPGETRRALVMLLDAPTPSLPHAHATTSLLSRRQHEVARLAAAGKSLPAIARTLGLSLETVRSHMRQAYQRLGVSSRVELAVLFGNSKKLT